MKSINKELFIKNIDRMINNSNKGASGFWYDTEDCCGNPEVFSEIKQGIKNHRSVNLEHDVCMWNRDIMYGNKSGNIQSGCFHCCGLRDAKYLSSKMLKDVLLRFKRRYLSGEYEKHKDYNCTVELKPLLTESEYNYIRKHQHLEPIRERQRKLSRAKDALKYAPDDKKWKNLLGAFYETNTVTADGIDFSKSFYKGIVGAENISYDECLYLQYKTTKEKKHYAFQSLYYNGIPLTFKGQIERISKGHICFKRIYIEEMYWNSKCVVNKEDHVWMDEKGFEGSFIGDCFEFGAEVYKYIKKSDGKIIDFGLRNPSNIKKIYNYQLPSDEIIVNQTFDDIVCESCYLYDRCDGLNCIRNS